MGITIFLDREVPRYATEYGVSLSIICLGLGTVVALELVLSLENKKKASYREEDIRGQYADEALDKPGDKSPLLKYRF